MCIYIIHVGIHISQTLLRKHTSNILTITFCVLIYTWLQINDTYHCLDEGTSKGFVTCHMIGRVTGNTTNGPRVMSKPRVVI